MTSDSWKEDVVSQLTTKSTHWSYEEEYRLMYWDGANTAIQLNNNCLKEVILGCRISEENRTEILELVGKLPNKVSVYESERAINRYGLEFKKL